LHKSIQFVGTFLLLSAISLAQTTGKVSVTSPISGSTDASPVHFVASAQAPANRHITAMRIYVDYTSVYTVYAATLNTNVSMAAGSHRATVQAWDNSGKVYKQILSLNVTGPTPTPTPTPAPSPTPSPSPTPTTVSVAISPTSLTLQGGQTKQFTASVTGTTNTSINWQVASTTGGTSTAGFISSTGVYTAPACPAASTETVTARSIYDTSAFANSTVTLSGGAPAGTGGNYYVATNGSDSNDGSACHPWATIQHASSLAQAGWTVHVAPGTYDVSSCSYPGGICYSISTSASGTASARIRFISDVKGGAKIVSGNSTYYAWGVDGSYVDIVGFDITGNSMTAIRLNGSNQRALNNVIHNMGTQFCDGNGGAGIVSSNYSAGSNDIIGNIVHDIGTPGGCNGVQGIYYSNYGGHILNNIVYRISAYGIHLWHAANAVTISNNTVFANGSSSMGGGILIGDGDSPGGVVNDHTIVTNNIIYANPDTGLREYCYSGTTCTGSNNVYSNNVIYQNGANLSLLFGHVASNTVSADPQFVNYQADGSGDYHLKSTSPAVDKGTNTGAPLTDFDGGPRPVGATWDIGAYEEGANPAAWPWQ
jgi:hypothetical protein